jgi:hypothetical protein
MGFRRVILIWAVAVFGVLNIIVLVVSVVSHRGYRCDIAEILYLKGARPRTRFLVLAYRKGAGTRSGRNSLKVLRIW